VGVCCVIDTSPTATSPLSLHDALPISHEVAGLGERLHAAVGAQVDDVGPAAALEGRGEDRVVLGVQVGRELDVYVGVLGPEGLRSEEHTSELQSRENLVCRLLLEKKKK